MNYNKKILGKVIYVITLLFLLVILYFAYEYYQSNNFNDFIRSEKNLYTSKFKRDKETKYSQKSSYKISSVEFNDGHITKVIDYIEYTVLYDKNDKELYKIEGGYLDIGLIDTMEDLIVNFVGAITFCLLWYFDIRKIDGFLNKHFVPVKK